MPLPVLDKANKVPIATIIKWFVERKNGKVVESRKEIQRRFDGLDWSVQKKVILAFLNSGKTDREWVYEQLIWFWDEAFLPKVKEVFEKYHEKHGLPAVSVISDLHIYCLRKGGCAGLWDYC